MRGSGEVLGAREVPERFGEVPEQFRSEERSRSKVAERFRSSFGEVPERGSGEVPEQGSGEVPKRFYTARLRSSSGAVPEQFRSKALGFGSEVLERFWSEVLVQGSGEVPGQLRCEVLERFLGGYGARSGEVPEQFRSEVWRRFRKRFRSEVPEKKHDTRLLTKYFRRIQRSDTFECENAR